ncbi:hypothetical protein LDENG_00156480 [Lucifuga dentata]|nr:hypothetical protein LDENG_00156480 [Lucifuga dentata]
MQRLRPRFINLSACFTASLCADITAQPHLFIHKRLLPTCFTVCLERGVPVIFPYLLVAVAIHKTNPHAKNKTCFSPV